MKKLPIGIQDFETLITGNNVYVDKTEHIYNLINRGSYYFLSRPRRFGKSLLVSTFKELFLCNRKLFKDLWIDKSDYNWQEYPVVHIDFSSISCSDIQDFILSFNIKLKDIAQDYGIELNHKLIGDNTNQFIKELSKKGKVVILIDEYDYPILKNIKDIELAQKIREVMQQFYVCVKSSGKYIKFLFMTGVTRFSQASIFSGLNNLNDISLKPEASELLGYTQDEIKNNFQDYLKVLSLKTDLSQEVTLEKIKIWYNGYRFSEKTNRVYNPFSVINCFNDNKFTNFWFRSGTPSFLISLLKSQYYELVDIPTQEMSRGDIGDFEVDKIPLVPLLFQTGYLTIENYNTESDTFNLNFPNFEVEDSFKRFLISILIDQTTTLVSANTKNLIHSLNTKNLDEFCKILQILLAKIPNSLSVKKENYFHAIFYFLMGLLSLEAKSEIQTNIGRIDVVLEMKDFIYIFELKLNIDPQVGLNQIKQKKYYESFLDKNKEIILVGLSFECGVDTFLVTHKSEVLKR